MRTRKSNKSKRYSEVPDYGLDDDVNETPTRSTPRDASDDDNFVVDASGAPADDDDFIAPDDSDVDIKDEPFIALGSDDDEDDVGPGSVHRKKRSYHSRRKLPPGHDATAMDPYPQESRFTQTRMHHGIFSSWIRTAFWDDFYGPDPHAASQAAEMFRKWAPYEVLPCKLLDEDWALQPTPWVRDDFESIEAAIARQWYERVHKESAGQVLRAITELEAAPYLGAEEGKLKVLGGPYPDQQQHSLDVNKALTVSSDGLPYNADAMDTDESADKPAGWMFDVGGLILAMSWLPRADTTTQILALAVSPFTDQDYDWQLELDAVNDEMDRGRIQLWEFKGSRGENGVMYPSREPPRLLRTLCFDWGRAKTIHWCPVPSTVENHLGLMAVLCNDHQVHLLDLQDHRDAAAPSYVKIDQAMTTIGNLPGLPAGVTIFAWAGTNRIVTAHTDGSIALWSLQPRQCISRHAVHSTHIYHLATGYPSNPYLVASTPVSGLAIVIDLLDPSVETTSQTNPAIVPQPDLLQWSDHLQGFVSISPSSRPLNSTIGFFHSRAFSATMRKVLDGDALLSCLAVGVQHPFVLVAFLDGTVWACNPMHRVFAPRHYPPAWKLKLLEHEHIPRMRLEESLNPDGGCRGVSRIVQGWKPVMNKGPQALINLARNTPSARPPKKKSRAIPRLKKTKKKADEVADSGAGGGDAENDEDGGLYADPEKIILREPLSRATAMAWNPNMDFACWAAISLASGLVKVMDLGVEYKPKD